MNAESAGSLPEVTKPAPTDIDVLPVPPAFKAHVEAIRDHGDTFERVPTTALWPGLAGFFAGAAEATRDVLSAPAPTAVVGGLAGIAGAYTAARYFNERRLRSKGVEALKEPYEIYGTYGAVMLWGPDTDQDDTPTMRQRLITVASHAREMGIDTLAMPTKAAKKAGFKDDDLYKVSNLTEQIDSFRHLGLPKQEGDFAIARPQGWLAPFQQREVTRLRMARITRVEKLLETYAALHPATDLLAYYRATARNPEVQTEEVKKRLTKILELRLNHDDSKMNPVYAAALRDPQYNGPRQNITRSTAFTKIGQLSQDGNSVTWTTAEGRAEQDAFAALGLQNERRARELCNRPAKDAHAQDTALAKTAILLEAYRQLARKPDETVYTTKEITRKEYDPSIELPRVERDQLGDVRRPEDAVGPLLLHKRRRQVLAATLAAAATYVAVYGVFSAGKAMGPDDYKSPPGAVALDEKSFGFGGNHVNDGDNEARYNFAPHAMKTTGYWALGTAYRMSDHSWDAGKAESDTAITLPMQLPANAKHWIKVDRVGEVSGTGIGERPEVVNMPVLEGTKPVAGMLDNKPLAVVEEGGTYGFRIPRNIIAHHLQYYVSPDMGAPKPYATYPLEVSGMAQTSGLNAQDEVRRIWRQVVPTRASTAGEQAKLDGAYILNHFTYSLDPLHRGALQSTVSEPWPVIAKTELTETHEAECATANGSIALDASSADPSAPRDQILNPVFGYRNNPGEGENIGSSHELHQWNADVFGNRYDATPEADAQAGGSTGSPSNAPDSGKDAPDKSKKYFDEKPLVKDEKGFEVPVFPLALGAIAAAAGGTVLKKHLTLHLPRLPKFSITLPKLPVRAPKAEADGRANTQRERATKYIASLNDKNARLTYAALAKVQYGAQGSGTDLAGARTQAHRDPRSADDIIMEIVKRQPGLFHPENAAVLRQAADQASGRDKRIYKMAAQVAESLHIRETKD